jgi:hypothetical protein
MKKMLLLLVSGLLIACIAGSAVAASNAGTLYIRDGASSSSAIITSSILMDKTSQQTIYAAASCPNEKTETYDVTVKRTDDPSGPIHLDVSPSGSSAFIFSWTSSTKGKEFYQPLVLTMTDAGDNEAYDITVAGKTLSVSVTSQVQSIPEFPTVAAPVAAVLGLLFVFGRKKEGL